MGQITITPLFVRHPFKVFDINSYLSLIIRLVINFKYNHCAGKYSEDGMEYVIESRSGGVFKSTYSNWLKHRPDKTWEAGQDFEVDVMDVNERLGIKYNIASLFDQLIYKFFKVWIGSTLDTQENCSELLADLLRLPESYLATPKSLYQLLKK